MGQLSWLPAVHGATAPHLAARLHPSTAPLGFHCCRFNVPFRYLPITPRDAASKKAQEAQIEELLEELGIDLIVLARYMQVRVLRVNSIL